MVTIPRSRKARLGVLTLQESYVGADPSLGPPGQIPHMATILLLEDDDSLRNVLKSILEHDGFRVDAHADADGALRALKGAVLDLVLTDYKLKRGNGLEFLKEVRIHSPHTPVLMMTAYGSIDLAVEAMKHGANDFITKPFDPQTLSSLVRQLIEHKRIVDRTLGTRTRRERLFLTADARVEKLLAQARKTARVDSSVLILGESGTGKELLARYLHEHSPRSEKPFIGVNCGAIPKDLLESELFGHEAGSFTGATQARLGIFELGSEGTIFLDEVGDMPLQLQVKLLRALQEREIKRVGGSKFIRVNPRIVCATNRDVDAAVAKGTMREDFYYRVAVMTMTLPPLRARPKDIDLLMEFYLDYFSNQSGKKRPELDPTARDLLLAYNWPGNARELENVIERAVLLSDTTILPEHLGIRVRLDFTALDESRLSLHQIAAQAAQEAERNVIERVLRLTKGNKSKAAEILAVSYKTLLHKVKEYDLGFDELAPLESPHQEEPPVASS